MSCQDCARVQEDLSGMRDLFFEIEETMCGRHLKEHKKKQHDKEMAYRKKHGLL